MNEIELNHWYDVLFIGSLGNLVAYNDVACADVIRLVTDYINNGYKVLYLFHQHN